MMTQVPEMGKLTGLNNATFVLGGTKLKYISAAADAVLFEGVEYGKR